MFKLLSELDQDGSLPLVVMVGGAGIVAVALGLVLLVAGAAELFLTWL